MGEKETDASISAGGGLTRAAAAAAGSRALAQYDAMSPAERAAAGICRACGGCITDAYGDCKGCSGGCTKAYCICQNEL